MGDGILVLFGAPTSEADDAQRAIACAIEMQLAMQPVNRQMAEWGFPALEMGIGINTGEVVVGNIGSEKRTKYGVVGAQVNLTYRIESYTTGGQILLSQATLEEAGEGVIVDTEKQVQPKGIPQPMTIYSVGGMAGKYNLFLPQEEEVFYLLESPIDLQYTILEGKEVSTTLFSGRLVQLSAKGALIMPIDSNNLLEIPPPMSNLKLNFFLQEKISYASDDLYAKVRERAPDRHDFYISFTAKPPSISRHLDELYESLKFQCTKI
jgi:adenylate cyclase